MRKILAALLALAMVLALVPAVMAENAPITVTVFKGDPGDQPTADNKIYKKIADELGITFEIEFLANDLNQTLALKIADDKQPDLFDGGNSAEQLEDADVLIDLLPYISEEKTPNLYKHIYTNDRIKQLLTEDGKLYIIPNYGPRRRSSSGTTTLCRRPLTSTSRCWKAIWPSIPLLKTAPPTPVSPSCAKTGVVSA